MELEWDQEEWWTFLMETNIQCEEIWGRSNNLRSDVGRVRIPIIPSKHIQTKENVFLFPFDRYDEGTAFIPVVEHKRLLPESDKFKFMALDEDGYDLPSDWYEHSSLPLHACSFKLKIIH
jgi:hypothetical protein